MKLLRCLILIVVASILTFSQSPQPEPEKLDKDGRWIYGTSEPWSMNEPSYTPEQAKTFLQRWAALKQAVKQTDNEWEGEYGGPGGETEAIQLKWTAKSGFVLVHGSLCMASVIQLSYGNVTADARHVRFRSEFAPPTIAYVGKKFARSLQISYVRVKWDSQHYLVPEADLKSFFGQISRGEGILSNFWFSKAGDSWEHDSLNNVQVPPGYEKYVSKPIEASITKVGKMVIRPGFDGYIGEWQMIPVTINAGRAQGVKKGTEFHILSFEDDNEIKVKRVFQNYSTGFVVRPIDDGKEEYPVIINQRTHPPLVGWKLTTFSKYIIF